MESIPPPERANEINGDRGGTLVRTESLCPECLAKIPARRVLSGREVFLVKHCPEHGVFRTVIWRGDPAFTGWVRPKRPTRPKVCATGIDSGCPYDCGLCPDHRQHSCTVLLEVTGRCNLHCPVCFARAGEDAGPDPSLDAIESWYRQVMAAGARCNIQLSGGEPTVRDDLPAIVELGRKTGFSFIQLNTNGLRLATDKDYARRLADAGLSSVFLQFDGTEEDIYLTLRGRPLLGEKLRAIDRCAENEIGVVLTPTLVPGVNTHVVGDIVRLALDRLPAVRGVHFQPVSYFGRYGKRPENDHRITLPEILRELERQTGGDIKATQFRPPGCENALCSFHGNFIRTPGGSLKALTSHGPREANSNTEYRNAKQIPMTQKGISKTDCCGAPVERAEEGAKKTVSVVARQWSAPAGTSLVGADASCCGSEPPGRRLGELDGFLEWARMYTLAISAMAFQDAWTLDLERLRDCCIHVFAPDGRLIPFCAYNLTSASGRPLYR